MSSEVVLSAPILAKVPAVGVFDRSGAVKLLNPHSHAHILHLEELSTREAL